MPARRRLRGSHKLLVPDLEEHSASTGQFVHVDAKDSHNGILQVLHDFTGMVDVGQAVILVSLTPPATLSVRYSPRN